MNYGCMRSPACFSCTACRLTAVVEPIACPAPWPQALPRARRVPLGPLAGRAVSAMARWAVLVHCDTQTVDTSCVFSWSFSLLPFLSILLISILFPLPPSIRNPAIRYACLLSLRPVPARRRVIPEPPSHRYPRCVRFPASALPRSAMAGLGESYCAGGGPRCVGGVVCGCEYAFARQVCVGRCGAGGFCDSGVGDRLCGEVPLCVIVALRMVSHSLAHFGLRLSACPPVTPRPSLPHQSTTNDCTV